MEHPEFTYCTIDACRSEFRNEEKAWKYLEENVKENSQVILESCGLDWRLEGLLTSLGSRKIITILLTGDEEDLVERLVNRQKKRPIPAWCRERDELESIYWVLDNLDNLPMSPDIEINTSGYTSEELYSYLTERVLLHLSSVRELS